MATTFLANWQALSPTISNAFVDVDISAYVSASATGITLKATNTSGSDKNFGFRNNGSTDSRNQQLNSGDWITFNVGVDGSQICEILLQFGWTGVVYLVGFFEGDATLNVDADDLSTASTSSWVDADISTLTGAETALAAILESRWNGFGTTADFGLRKNGSTDARFATNAQLHAGAVIGVDGSEIFEQYIADAKIDVFLLGWMTSNVTMHTNGIDRSTTTTASYEAITSPDADADGAIYECVGSGDLGLRGLSQTTDLTDAYAHNWAVEKCDTAQCEQYISATTADIYELGWIGTAAGVTAAITGTITATVDEDDITTGGKTVIVTLTGDTFKAAGTGPIGSTADTQALIDGFDAASSPTNGWNNEVRDKAATTEVVRTSSTVATWTVAAQAGYDISAQEVITGTIPTDVLVTGAGAITGTPTFTVDPVSSGTSKFLLLLGAG